MTDPVLRVGVGGPVGSGTTALIEALVPVLIARGHTPAVITNDIYTQEDAEHVRRTLAGVLDGGPETLLDDYAATRRPIAERVVNLTDKMTRAAHLRSPLLRALRNALLPVLTAIPAVRRTLATNFAELNLR